MHTTLKTGLIAFLALLTASIVVLSLVPPVSKDALVHHLAVPLLYLKHGGIYEIPSMPFSYYPMNVDLIYLLPLYFGNDIIPKFLHFGFAILTALLIYSYLRRKIDSVYALFGSLFFLSTPIILKLSITVYVDLGLIFFSTGALLMLLEWMERGFQKRFLFFSALFCGLAMGTKYNGLVTFFILAAFVPLIFAKYGRHRSSGTLRVLRVGAFFAGIALLFFLPWALRNYLWTGNPVFPLFHELVHPGADAAKEFLSVFTKRALLYDESWWEIALVPLRIFFQGQDGSPKYFDGVLNPFLLILPFFAYFRTRSGKLDFKAEKNILAAFAVLYFFIAFFTTGMRIRYISPIIPPLVILSAYGLKNLSGVLAKILSRGGVRAGKGAVLGAGIAVLFINSGYVVEQFKVVEPFGYLSGETGRDEYIAKYREEYPAMKYINNNAPKDARILFVYVGKRGYYCERAYQVLGIDVLGEILKRSETPGEVINGLEEKGFTHLLVRYDFLKRWAKENLDKQKREILRKIMKERFRLLYFRKGFGVFRISQA